MTNTEMDRSTDHDSPWKIALDGYSKEFLELLFPNIPAERRFFECDLCDRGGQENALYQYG